MAKNYRGFRKELAVKVYDNEEGADTPECPRCGETMQFHGGDLAIGQGYWDCSNCGFKVEENELDQYNDYVTDPYRF